MEATRRKWHPRVSGLSGLSCAWGRGGGVLDVFVFGFWVLGALQNRSLPQYKSVGIRNLFGNIKGGAIPGPKINQKQNK
jgi:hypothetical protein